MKLFKFEASWCGPCKMMQPQLDKLSMDPDFSEVEFERVDVDEEPTFARLNEVMSVPTILLATNEGYELYRTTGVKSADKLKAELQPFLDNE